MLEERFVALCEQHALPMPEMNARVCGLTVDALWRDRGLVVELDGHAAHSSAARREVDRERDMTLRRARLQVVRYTSMQVTRRAESVAAEVRRELYNRPRWLPA